MRQCKNYMEIGRWQQISHLILQPLLPFHAATIGTMAIAAVVVLIRLMATVGIITAQQMNAYIGRSAVSQLTEHRLTIGISRLPNGRTKDNILLQKTDNPDLLLTFH